MGRKGKEPSSFCIIYYSCANVLTIFILPYIDMSLRDQILRVFFKDPNFSKNFFFSKMYSKRINWFVVTLEVKKCVFSMTHGAEP